MAEASVPTGGARPTAGRSPFPPIADYGFLSDCEVCALVAPSGNVEWMCLPRMAGPSVFAAILDRGAGTFRLGPSDVVVPAGRRYLPGTMALETTWATPGGRAGAAPPGPVPERLHRRRAGMRARVRLRSPARDLASHRKRLRARGGPA